MKTAISFCPNDTFLFHAWSEKLIDCEIYPSLYFADIQKLNESALNKEFPLIKVSLALLPQLIDHYCLLPVGSALGEKCGPILISTHSFQIEELPLKTIAIPGKLTTAHALFDRLGYKTKKKIFCSYDEIFSLLKSGEADCGIIIHESRFVFEKQGFYQILDLGHEWQNRFQLPIPLGGIVVKKNFSQIPSLIKALQNSYHFGILNPSLSTSFILTHSKEKNEAIVQSHIQLYVNAETYQLSQKGIQAIEKLIQMEKDQWLYF